MPEEWTEKTLAEAGPRFSLKSRSPESLAAWRRYIPFTPKGLLDAICNGSLATARLHVDIRENGYANLKITLPGEDGAEQFHCLCGLSPSGGDSDFKNVQVTPSLQGRGLARLAVRNIVAVAREMGISRIGTWAALEHGGYAWARFGFAPSPGSWDFLRSNFLHPRLKLLADCIPQNAKAQLEAALASDDPQSIFLIAAIKTPAAHVPVGRILLSGGAWNPDGASPPDEDTWEMMKESAMKRLQSVFHLLPPGEPRKIQNLLQVRTPNAFAVLNIGHSFRGIPVGKLMLLGTYWEGGIDFENPRQANIFNACMGQDTPDAPAANPPAPTRKPGGPHG